MSLDVTLLRLDAHNDRLAMLHQELTAELPPEHVARWP